MWDNRDGHWDGMHDGGGGVLMVLLMVVLVAAVVVALVALMRGTVHAGAAPSPAPRVADPRAILQQRLARGEIDEQDFRARMRALDESVSADG